MMIKLLGCTCIATAAACLGFRAAARLKGQLRALERSIRETELALRAVREGAPERRRSWQTLGLCAGAALAILFV